MAVTLRPSSATRRTHTGVSGICLPSQAGSDADRWAFDSAVHLRSLATQQIRQHARDADDSPLQYAVLAAWEQMSPLESGVVFRHWLAYALAHAPVDGTGNEGVAGVQILVGAPVAGSCEMVLGKTAFSRRPLYFPWLHLSVLGGPVAVFGTHEEVRFTWADGFAATFPTMPTESIGFAGTDLNGRVAGGTFGELPIANGMGEFHETAAESTPRARATFSEGLSLLKEVWPDAYASSKRFLTGVQFLPRPVDHVVSHSTGSHHGLLFTSVHTPLQVADAICHEASHTRLNLILERGPIMEDDGAAIHDSPWRRDKRPLIGIVNGVHAFLNVALLYRRIAGIDPTIRASAERIANDQTKKVRAGWDYVSGRLKPTAIGSEFLADLALNVQQL